MNEESLEGQQGILLYDGECPFCCSSVAHWEPLVKGKVNVVTAQSGGGEKYGFPAGQGAGALTLIEGSGEILSGAAAVFRLLEIQGSRLGALLWWTYRRAKPFQALADWGYRMVARYRYLIPINNK
jgi:predicted DCC family thiol-disulfide oxidoreductase YuxK